MRAEITGSPCDRRVVRVIGDEPVSGGGEGGGLGRVLGEGPKLGEGLGREQGEGPKLREGLGRVLGEGLGRKRSEEQA